MKLIVNETERDIEVHEEGPLLWIIRDQLGLKGTKFGCGKGLCGSCTVLLDGAPIRSCSFPAHAAENKKVTTIEGLSDAGDHPLQKAWKKFDVPQCGYCQPGQIMQAAGLLKHNPAPTSLEIKDHMNGNLCRCGTYNRINKAIVEAAKTLNADLKGQKELR